MKMNNIILKLHTGVILFSFLMVYIVCKCHSECFPSLCQTETCAKLQCQDAESSRQL